jgi:hypothetical protein
MKSLFITLVFILAFSFCGNKKKMIQMPEEDAVFRLSEHYSKFKFHDLTEFKIDSSVAYEKISQEYQKLDSLIAYKIFRQGDSWSPYDSYLCYSTFSDSTLISVLEYSEGNGWIIWLCKFNKEGKFIEKEMIANKLIDGGEYWRSRGKFIGNNTFIHTEIDSWDLKDEDEKIDSTIVKISFDRNNKFKIDTLFKNQEIIKNKKE